MANNGVRGHAVLFPYPAQGHVNPMLQFAKRLTSKGLKTTLLLTPYIAKTISHPSFESSVQLDTVSDGFDEGGFAQADSIDDFLKRLRDHGSKSLSDVITKLEGSNHPVNCVIYDSFLPWALMVAHNFGLVAAAFFTQPCTVNYIYYRVQRDLPLLARPDCTPGLPVLDVQDFPTLVSLPESYPAYLELLKNQFSNEEESDYALVNTFYDLESEVLDYMSELLRNPLLAIGPTVPSLYLDNRIENDNEYGVNLFSLDPSISLNWLNTKPPSSVVYVSFGSLASLKEEQMNELANALKTITTSAISFLWVVRDSEASRLPKDFEVENSKGLVVNWSPQLQVLAHRSVGCFFTHCGWNSTSEALSLGVPMVAMPQWTDQTTNAKLVEDVWGVGMRVKNDSEDGVVRKEEIVRCVREVMSGERAETLKENAKKWKELAKKAVVDGGSSDRETKRFVSMVINQNG